MLQKISGSFILDREVTLSAFVFLSRITELQIREGIEDRIIQR